MARKTTKKSAKKTTRKAAKKTKTTLKTAKAAPDARRRESNFNIEIDFVGGLTQRQRAVFTAAAARWSEIIVGDLPSVSLDDGTVVDDVLITAEGARIDGPRGILGQASPRLVRSGSWLPATGFMQFDTADLSRMEADGSLENVIIHEMGHVLGIGTIWEGLGLLQGAGTSNPVFTGQNAMREFAELTRGEVVPVPVANTGGPGTRDGHWRENVFGSELMTGFINTGINPMSRLTIATLEDMGYEVDYDAADSYALPSTLRMAIMGIGADEEVRFEQCSMCSHRRLTAPVMLSESAYV